MSSNKHLHPDQLEKYSFLWSEARLVIAAIALFLGGVPPILEIIHASFVYSLLNIAWIISGVASVYLLYRWNQNRRKLFGKRETLDTVAFFVSIVSGINLGLVGVINTNIGMNISSSTFAFVVVGVIYLASAAYLFQRWNSHHRKLF